MKTKTGWILFVVFASAVSFVIGMSYGQGGIESRLDQTQNTESSERVVSVENAVQVAREPEKVRNLEIEVVELQTQLATTKLKLKLQTALVQGDRAELAKYEDDGETPVKWPEDTPQRYRQQHILDSIIRAVIKESKSDMDITSIDCKEAPCIVSISTNGNDRWTSEFMATEAWRDNYQAVNSRGDTIQCEDGKEEDVVFFGLLFNGWEDSIKLNIGKRSMGRMDKMKQSLKCKKSK